MGIVKRAAVESFYGMYAPLIAAARAVSRSFSSPSKIVTVNVPTEKVPSVAVRRRKHYQKR